MPLSDTTPEIERMQRKIVLRMSPEERVLRMARLSEEMHEVLRAGIRSRNPTWTPRQVMREFFRLTLPPELYRAAFEETATP